VKNVPQIQFLANKKIKINKFFEKFLFFEQFLQLFFQIRSLQKNLLPKGQYGYQERQTFTLVPKQRKN